jgi:hypothetical protein
VGDWSQEDHGVKIENHSTDPDGALSKDAAAVEEPIYKIRVKGHLGDHWADWFEGLTISQEKDGSTVLTGPMADQAALHGLLVKIRNLCLPLLAVNRVALPLGERSQAAEEEQSYESGRE